MRRWSRGVIAVGCALLLSGCAGGRAFRSGEVAARGGNWDAAVEYYRLAMQDAPDRPEYRIALERAMLNAARAHLALPLPQILPAGLIMRVGSSEFVPQFEGEGHGDELGVTVPQELRAGRVARAPEPPAQAPDQTDGVAEARRRRQLA